MKIEVIDGENGLAIIKLSGQSKDILSNIKTEIELFEKIYIFSSD